MSTLLKAVRVGGLELKIRDSGVGDPALVFLHYWGGAGRTWDLVAAKLSDRFRCVAPDLRGCSGSDKSAKDYSLEAYANDVLALATTLGLSRYVLVGHSMGGKIAQIIGSRQPEGLKALVLIAPAPPTPMAVPPEQRQMMLESYQTRQGAEAALGILAGRRLSAQLREQVIADTLSGAPAAKRAWTDEGMVLDIAPFVGRIAVPTVVIVGDADRVEHEEVLRRELASRVPGTEVVVLPGIGHLSPLEAPGELACSIAEFLARSDLA